MRSSWLWRRVPARVSLLALGLSLSVGGGLKGQESTGGVKEQGPLAKAVRASRIDEVRSLLESGVPPTPLALYAAVNLRDTTIAKMLIAAGADVNAQVTLGDTGEAMTVAPLFAAALSGRPDMVRILLEAGADPSATNDFLGMKMNALDAASMKGDTEVIRLLSGAGASHGTSAAAAAAAGMGWVEALQDGDVDAVQAFLDSGVDVNGLVLGSTPLSLAAGYRKGDPGRQEALVALLIEAGADVNARNEDGSTAFMHAAARGATGTMTLLLKAGADPDARDLNGRHAVSYADGYDPAVDVVVGASSDLSSYLNTPGVTGGGRYGPGSYTGPCGKSGAPPPAGIPEKPSGVTVETSTLIRGPDGSKAAVKSPECAPVLLSVSGEYEAVTTTCSTDWSVSSYTLRETTGAATELAYLRKDSSCSDEEFTFSIDPALESRGAEDRCRSANLTLVSPSPHDQFAFDAADTAWVEIPLEATVVPEDCGEELEWEATEVEGSTQMLLSGSAAAAPGTARLAYSGLPATNDAFGPITIRATLGSQTQEVEVELFYDPRATNHPREHPFLSSLGYKGFPADKVPNWFYYWTQTDAMLPDAPSLVRYAPAIPAKNNPTDRVAARFVLTDVVLLVSDLVYTAGCRERKDPATLAPTGQRAKGIDCFAELVRHEYQHWEEEKAWWRAGAGGLPLIGGLVRLARSFREDADHDNVPALVEAVYGGGCTDERPRSCARLPFADVYDGEINAYYVGWQRWPLPGAADDQDWSRCGKQWKKKGC